MTKQQLEAAGFKEANGIYDTRDWNAIRNWAEELATAVYRTGKSPRARTLIEVFRPRSFSLASLDACIMAFKRKNELGCRYQKLFQS